MTHLSLPLYQALGLSETTTVSLTANHQRGLSAEFYTWLHTHKQLQRTGASSKQHTNICSHLRRSEQVAAWITRNAALDKGQCREGLHKYTKELSETKHYTKTYLWYIKDLKQYSSGSMQSYFINNKALV